jgi:uncharacterized membrane protein SirB2
MPMYDILLIIHFLSLGAGLGISLTMFVLGLQADRIPPQEFGPMMGRVGLAVRGVSITGVTLLVLSGIGMLLLERGMVSAGGIWLPIKLVFVAGVVIAFAAAQVYQARARRGVNPAVAGRRAMHAGRIALICAVIATILAVIAFA